MLIIFVRHGESELNKKGKHQFSDTKLSKVGIKQAELVSKRLFGIKADLIISSKYQRAKQTAQIINRRLKKKVVYTDLFIEKKGPTEIIGHQHGGPEEIKYLLEREKHLNDPKWHYSDEENFFDVKKRARKAINYLLKTGKKSVIVVSHGTFMRTLMAVGIFGDEISIKDLKKFVRAYPIENTAITEFEISKDEGLKVLTFNDFLHLK